MNEHASDDLATGAELAKDGIKAAAKGVKDTANTAKATERAIEKASGGDVLGAAKEVLEDKGLRSTIIAIIFSAFILFYVVFVSGPLAIYEGLKNFTDQFENRWEELYYSDDRNRFFAAISATTKGLSESLKDFWNDITAGFETYSDDGELDKDSLDETDLLVLGDTEPLTVTYQKKIDAVIAKLQSRERQIIEAIKSSASGSKNSTANINGWVYKNLYPSDKAYYQSFASDTVTVEVIYGGVKVNAASQDLSKRDAIKLIALYSAQYNSDFDNIKPSALMRWLGYRAGTGQRTFTVGGSAGISCSVKEWKGEFMPQYLVDEMMQNPEGDYSKYQAPAADVMLFCDSQDLATLEPSVTIDKKTIYEEHTVTAWRWMFMPNKYYKENYNYLPQEIPAPATPKPDPFVSPDGRGGFEDWDWYYISEEKIEVTERTEITYTLTYSMNVCVGVRSLDVLSDLAGFYEEKD